MAQLLVLVIDEEDMTPDILTAWEQAGVPGVTMIDSAGSQHKHDNTRDDLPLIVSLRSVLEASEKETRTFLSVIEDDAVLNQAIAAVLRIIPDFNQGHRGIMFTVPVGRVWGYTSGPAQPKHE
jgi:hypothetical protein